MNDATQDSAAAAQPRIPPFWHKLNDFFLFPFQMEPLLWSIGLTALSCVAVLLMTAGIFGILGVLPTYALILWCSVYYSFKVATLASRGVLHSKDYNYSMMDPGWKTLPWALFGVLVVYVIILGYAFETSLTLGWLAWLVLSLLLPATMMVLILTRDILSALNPLALLSTVASIGWQYLLLCLFLFLLQGGASIAVAMLEPVVPQMLLWPASFFAGFSFYWVMAALIGYVMYQHHAALGIDLLRQPAAKGVSAADAARELTRQRDAEVSALAREDNLREAIKLAHEWARANYDSVPDADRYHRVLLLDDPASGRLARHAQRYLPLLLQRQQGPQALQAFQAVTEKVPGFTLEKPADTLALAEYAWKRHDAKRALEILRGFDKRYPGAKEIPRVYELAIRVLKQGLERGDKALPIYQTLARRYPDHASTEEAAWVLREELKAD
ncbi:MAG: hypothetical protein LBE33_07185 [Zoogloeaceae bacterium]|jgi:tetratricopeptide (TPR) repeat protein|nr:hypothetical protein [Zoogloeaceae bacterium]